jgi:hypothetical protein
MTTTLQIPLTLLREEMDGQPYYYKGYRQVLSGEKQPAEIMGSSELRSYLVALILRRLFVLLPESEYLIQTGEPGLNIAPGDNLANDITIRRTKDSLIDRNATGHAKKPPLVVLEVDIKVDTANGSDLDYVLTKTEKLLAFGVEQVIWILMTASRKIVVATLRNPSLTPYDWKQSVPLIDNCEMNLEEWVQKGVFSV